MLNSSFILENPELVKKAAKSKGIEVDIDAVVKKLHQYKTIATEVQAIREERNRFQEALKNALKNKSQAQEFSPEELKRALDKSKEKEKKEFSPEIIKRAIDLSEEQKKRDQLLKADLNQKEKDLKELHGELHKLLINIPNLPKDDVKVGKDESENEVIRKHKAPTAFDFEPKDHLVLGESLDIIDVERAAKVSGARFAYLKNDAVLLEFALVQYALDFLMKEGFTPVVTPDLIKQETMRGLGYMENGGDEDMFMIPKDNLVLVGTAEHALVPMHMGEVLDKKQLPLRYVGFSNAYRREAGSYGKDTRGILRVHQFDKVEMVSFAERDKDDLEHEYLLAIEEKLFQSLDIPYQVVKMCTGDLGFPAARKYDIEAWMPAQNKYREVTSVSTVTDFQSRRLKIRYKDGNTTEYASILNGTAFAIGRTIIAIMENYQQEDGSIIVPEVLRKYVGKDKISK